MVNAPQKIVIIGPAWVGDMVMAQTLFIVLKQKNPSCIIDVCAPHSTLPLLSRMPEVRQSYVLPFQHGELRLYQRYLLGKVLRSEKYDQCIVLPQSFKSALIPFFASIPRRTGYVGEYRFGLLNDARPLDKKKLPLMIQRFAALALSPNESLPEKLPTPQLHSNKKMGRDKPVIALCPGAEYGPAKRWPARYFAEVANQKISEGWDVWILGGPKDIPQALEIQAHTKNKCVDYTGKTTLLEAIDLIASSQVVVSNDSGLMHIACALNIPTVVIYGSSDPRFTPPLNDRATHLSLNLSCSPCFERVCPLKHTHCLNHLSPDKVIHALEELMSCVY